MTGARMWPARLPAQVLDNELRQAEVRVYDALEKALGPEWVVFYSRPWLGLNAYGEEKDGEADFVVVHPVRGYLTLEVKGGGISMNPATGQWISTDRDDIRHRIKNPVEQARASKHILIDKVKEMPRWPGRYVRMAHGVVFPDTVQPPRSLGADMPRDLFCCRDDLPSIGDFVRDRLSVEKGQELGEGGVQAFEDLLAAPINLKVPLAHYLDDDENAIARLTPQQFLVLEAFMYLDRVAAGGGAGTGKTIVAMEDALRLSDKGMRTALLCLGTRLAAHMRDRLKATKVDVFSVSELARHAAERAGLAMPNDGSVPSDETIDVLAGALKALPDLRYDAVVVDEGQDFRSHWWIVLEELLANQTTSKLHVFYDTNQSVYGDVTTELAVFSTIPVRLTRNLRNTRNIHDAAIRFYQGNEIIPDGPEGAVVHWVPCSAAGVVTNVMSHLRSLTSDDEVSPENIAILAMNDDVLRTLEKQTAAFDGITVTHVRDFKGLERQAVIVAATKEIADFPELAYVALSRPRVHLSVCGEQGILDWLQAAA